MTTVVILQSNYIPWRGYFDLIRRADHFVFYDNVQYTKRDWRNRNTIIAPSGPILLTVPVATTGLYEQTIEEARISDSRWATKHLKTFQLGLARGPYFKSQLEPLLSEWFAEIAPFERLGSVNRFLIEQVLQVLDIKTTLHDAADLPQDGNKSGRLVSICRALGATRYLSGPAAKSYLDEAQFATAGIAVDWMDYPAYPVYQQTDGKYQAGVSILDCLAHLRPDKVF